MSGPALALASAALFGLSPPLAKALVGEMSPSLLAGLLYLGAFSGLGLFLLARGRPFLAELRGLSARHRLKAAGAVAAGGVLAPLCLAYGVKAASAFEVSLLLNLETTATALIAWLAFKEHVGRRVWASQTLVVAGAAALTVQPGGAGFSAPGLLVLAACVFWAVDNNLTRDVEDISPAALAALKGLGGGTFNVALAFALGQGAVALPQAAGSLLLGALSYGVSLVLFISALRELGSSRAATYFSVALLGERPSLNHWLAGAAMTAGLTLLARESHSHVHTHEPLEHRHLHHHGDAHHCHAHEDEQSQDRHDHLHAHEPLTHAHVHWPDTHHRH